MPNPDPKKFKKVEDLLAGGMALYPACRETKCSPKAFNRWKNGTPRKKRTPRKGKYQAIMIADPIDDKITMSAKQLAQFVKEFHR